MVTNILQPCFPLLRPYSTALLATKYVGSGVVLPTLAPSCGDTSATKLIVESFISAPNCGPLTSSATGFTRMATPTFGT